MWSSYTARADEETTANAKRASHWAFQPVADVKPPVTNDDTWSRNAIDAFILARLKAQGLIPLPQASRTTLIRRVTFDLTGLPPTAAEIDAFIKDDAPDAYEQLVDRLLASSAYGERWAQHWLDLARFAETDGYEHDKTRGEAFRYRDWVINALNADMPFDRFVREQIAGDELGGAGSDDAAAAIATGFLLAGPDMPDINDQEERRHVKLNEMTATVGAVFMGITLECASCHDHKYDPITQRDFYALRAILANTVHPKRDVALGLRAHEPGAKAKPQYLMVRGDFRQPGPVVEPAFPVAINLHHDAVEPPPQDATSSMRRAALAHWLTQPDHPLTTRVIVNRLWQHHFGRGIVETPSDFGVMGARPTHPLLLDWLARELVRQDWSLKQIHRLMVTSATYRQASRSGDIDEALRPAAQESMTAAARVDPDNHLLWRMNRQRLDGEAIRDAMLSAAGRLSRRAGGPGVMAPLPKEVVATLLSNQWKVTDDVAEHDRRSIYLFVRRNLRFPIFDAFDRPDGNVTCARRPQSTTAPQALMLINSEFSLNMSQSTAGRAWREHGESTESRVIACYMWTLGRTPSPQEMALAQQFLEADAARLKVANRKTDTMALPTPMPPQVEGHDAAALVDMCLALFNLNEFIYVD